MLSAQQFLKEFNNVESLDESLYEIVSQICEEVKLQGDKALKNYNLQFDQVETENLELEQNQLKNAYDMLDNKTRDALEQSYQRIKVYQENIKVKQESSQQTECYERYHPIERVGIYVPGGKASYPSTVLMTATLAQVAGVNEITVVTPPQNNGICQEVLAACCSSCLSSRWSTKYCSTNLWHGNYKKSRQNCRSWKSICCLCQKVCIRSSRHRPNRRTDRNSLDYRRKC
ncbi:histidinol dehydrogenase-like protein [Staphylococcus epidermidis VCU127]|nr:histidinol dehydrogenase-like protein [Staphylococcus epidermidis VCU127]